MAITDYGGNDDDELVGSEDDDRLYGVGGNDTLSGYGGNDRLDGGEGNDALWGYGGNDLLIGGGGHDVLRGQEGDDYLWAGPGFDTLRGGSGSDTFAFERNEGRDRIEDYQPGIDRIVVSGVAEYEYRYSDIPNGHTLVTWGDPDTDVVLLGLTSDIWN